MEKSLGYDDVYLSPQYSELKTRAEANISVDFLGRKFKAPWLPANMESVVDDSICHWLGENDYFYIMHRFCDVYRFVQLANKEKWKLISISIGVKQQDKDTLLKILKSGLRVDFVTIDVAHGHSALVKEMIEYIKGIYLLLAPNIINPLPIIPKIIAGNVATPEAVRDLADWGADAVKVGIAGGAACSTKHQTGFHIPMFSCVEKCKKQGGGIGEGSIIMGNGNVFICPMVLEASIPIVADGGIRENGHIPKALVAGATMVMAGSLFVACIDAPGENVYGERKITHADTGLYETLGPITHKKYHGSASAKQKGERKHVEGFETEIPCNGLTIEEKYKELIESLQSAVSYAGGKDLKAFEKVGYITIK